MVSSVIIATLTLFTAAAVEPGLPSKTSILAATLRAVGAKNPDPELRNPDYLAARFLGPRERAIMTDFPMEVLDLDYADAIRRLSLQDRGSVTTMFIRTKHLDAALEREAQAGASQVIILGAGFDTRGYRFQDRFARVRFFEVDYGPTQEYKEQRVKETLGALSKQVHYIAMDFTRDDLLSQLRAGGYSEKEKSLFIWEGVTVYIPEASVRATLEFVRDHSAPGSAIAFDYMLRSDPRINDPNSRYARWQEPWIFGFPGDSAVGYVRRVGLTVDSDSAMGDLAGQYVRRSTGISALPSLPAGQKSRRICIARVPPHH